MLIQLRNRELFPRAYIPINPNPNIPTAEHLKEERKERRAQAKLRREREAVLRALQMPFVFALTMPEAETLEDIEEESVSVTAVGPVLDNDPIYWTVEDILLLHSVLLVQSIKALRASGNPREKLDVLEWMFAPDLVGEVVRQTPYGPRTARVYTRDLAFSFVFCCRLEGHDPEVYRRFISQEMPEAVSRFLAVVDHQGDVSHVTVHDRNIWL